MTPSTQADTGRLAPDEAGIAQAASRLAAGGLVAFPTETVYGLGADGRDGRAVAALYAAKGRPSFNPLIAHVAGMDAARAEGVFAPVAMRLAEAFWPGPLTLVVPRQADGTVCDLARAGLDSVGLRMPSHPVARDLLRRAGFPVVAPSANLSGRISPTSPEDVLADLDGIIDAVVMGGRTEVGVESTIVAILDGEPSLLRPGGVPREAIEALLGRPLASGRDAGETPIAPGALLSHYAPRATVRLEAKVIRPGEAALLFGSVPPAGLEVAAASRDLSPGGDLAEAAANLFGHLRALDASGATSIAVVPIPDHGLGEAINDRLRRAAAER
ncbi:L-threonylcarbamoyladenylate synthase [Enterovirga rhinocerotis]|uniref:Threonylcarbamoyl-AMP synthase n=2 Tax=Enterovirga rhinocerotis TaxID=1339210 RepID=A0A4R7CB81_9HYPH|nr:L-threonylcarbamoyladenylate synthase [Enterovirga rhinocerotis]